MPVSGPEVVLYQKHLDTLVKQSAMNQTHGGTRDFLSPDSCDNAKAFENAEVVNHIGKLVGTCRENIYRVTSL